MKTAPVSCIFLSIISLSICGSRTPLDIGDRHLDIGDRHSDIGLSLPSSPCLDQDHYISPTQCPKQSINATTNLNELCMTTNLNRMTFSS